ncbi:hypothetical protein ACFQZS_06760 [Mucilaginibacter calamicampi]|uniref:Uncharacterized protein n=1 Tax=Mucilaginibacter calamicampi TaxID=1302352 RepID=A0ABW2YZD4_9SPHI
MKKLNITLLFLLSSTLVYSQYAKLKGMIGVELTGKEAALAKKYMTCINTGRYNSTQRRKFIPFASSTAVTLISFRSDYSPIKPVAVNNFSIDTKLVKESRQLTSSEIDSLTDILFNVGYSPVKLPFKLIDPGFTCYEPRNAILFADAKGRITHYIEYCFECQKYYLSSSKIMNTEYCEQKYDMLRKFFLKSGITYGTTTVKRD